MNRPLTRFFLALSLLMFAPIAQEALAQGQTTLSIRMVRAGVGTEIDPSLKDVAALMRGNLAFSSFSLLESKTVTLPATTPIKMGKNYKITLKGPARNLDVVISQGNRVLIKTHVVLQGQSPLVLGGFASKEGAILFVLNLQK